MYQSSVDYGAAQGQARIGPIGLIVIDVVGTSPNHQPHLVPSRNVDADAQPVGPTCHQRASNEGVGAAYLARK